MLPDQRQGAFNLLDGALISSTLEVSSPDRGGISDKTAGDGANRAEFSQPNGMAPRLRGDFVGDPQSALADSATGTLDAEPSSAAGSTAGEEVHCEVRCDSIP